MMQAERSDKSSLGNGYINAYAPLLGPWRHRVATFIEVGIGSLNSRVSKTSMLGWATGHRGGGAGSGYRPGASLRAWARYLPNARVIGVDLDAKVVAAVNAARVRAADAPSESAHERRVSAVVADTRHSARMLRDRLRAHGVSEASVDIILDDGLHSWAGQQQTLVALWPYLRAGGYYFVEDLAMAFDRPISATGWLEAIVSARGAAKELATRADARAILEVAHGVPLPVGAFNDQGKATDPSVVLLLTKGASRGASTSSRVPEQS
jgi:hypothetical protein